MKSVFSSSDSPYNVHFSSFSCHLMNSRQVFIKRGLSDLFFLIFLLTFATMKRIMNIFFLTVGVAVASFGQTPSEKSDNSLVDTTFQLKGITVQGRLPMRVNENGALHYSGQQLIANRPIRHALDMLDEIPTLQKSGTAYTIVGATSFCILVNGKKSGMNQEQLLSYLSSLSPNRVASIDVYYNTPRRFGVRGASVNITLTKEHSNSLKLNGDVNASLSQATYTGANGGLNLALSSPKWSANMGYAGTYNKSATHMNLNALHSLAGHTYDVAQTDHHTFKSFDNSLYADADITLGEHTSISLSYVLQHDHPKSNATAATTINAAPILSDTHTKSPSWLHNLEASLSHHDFEIGASATFYNEKEHQDLTDSQQSSLDCSYKQQVSKLSLFVDHKISLMGGHINYGFRGNIATTTNHKDFLSSQGFTGESFKFEQKEQTGSAYVGYRHSLGKKGFINLSLESEYFHSSYSKDGVPATTLWQEWQLYPSLTFVYRPRTARVIQLTFNSEKRYPTYWTTAANRTYINTYCVNDGNTSLKPYVKYSLNFNYIIQSKYVLGVFAESSPHRFTQSMTLSDKELCAIYKYFNMRHDYRYGLMAVLPIDWTQQFQSRLTTMVFDMHQSGQLDATAFSKRKVASMLRLNNNLSLFQKKLLLELSSWYQFPAIQGCYDIQEMYSVSAGITWIPPVDGLSLTFHGEDIFDTYRTRTKCHIGQTSYAFTNQVDMQAFSLTVRYTFNGYKTHKQKSVDTSRFGK